jgi:hypothetical protein
MNEERFRELARQAGVLIDWGEDIKVGRWGIGGNYKNMQKFAELIVRECMRMCDCADSSYLEHGCDLEASGAAGAKEIIKEWFEVEE